ncbi:MAG: CHAT domain-containing protein [Blastocatellales bacterium]
MRLRKKTVPMRSRRDHGKRPKSSVWLAAFVLAALPSHTQAAINNQDGDLRPLTFGAPVERELTSGQIHHYQITLSAGQYAQIAVDQRGIDVTLRVMAPDGQQLLESDGPGGAQSIETAALVAETAGVYRLTISALAKDAPAGRYEARIAELRAATQRDRDEVAGQRRLEVGMRLMAQGAKDKFEAALKQMEEARALFRSADDPAGEGNALNFLGIISLTRGDSRSAVEYLKQAWELQRQTADNQQTYQAKAALLGNLAVAYAQLGQTPQAAESLKQALPLMRAAQDKGGEAKLLASLGSVHHTLGQLQQASDYFQQALSLFRPLGDKGSAGVTLNNLGTLYRHLGEVDKAKDALRQALPLLRAAGDKRVEGIALDNLGVLYRATGDFQAALEQFNQALSLRRALGDKRGEAITLGNIGVARREMGDAQKALEYHAQALSLLQAAGDTHRSALTLDNMGVTYRKLGDLPQALAHHRRALPLLEAVGDQLAQAAVLKNIAWIEREQGSLAAARSAIEQAIALLEFLRANVNSQETRSSFLATVADYYELNTDVLMRLHALEPQAGHAQAAFKISEQGRARSLLELLNEARGDIRQGVSDALLERERSLRNRLTTRLDSLTRILGSKATDAQKSATRKEVSDLTDEYRKVQAEIRQTSPRYAALTQPQPLSAAEIQSQLLDDDTLLLEYSLGEKRSYLWLVSPQSLTAHELPPRAEIETAARKVYELLTARQPKPGLTEAQQRARIASAEAEFKTQTTALSRTLLGPVAAQLGNKRLVIVASGALEYIPFAALPAPAATTANYQPLIAGHEVVNLPSASSLAIIRSETASRRAAEKTVAVLADPVFEANDPRVALARGKKTTGADDAKPSAIAANLQRAMRSFDASAGRAALTRLPFSREEAEAIAALAPAGKTLKATGFNANRSTATSDDIGRYRIVHFATHGLLNSENPELSGLVFSLIDEDGKPQDGFLRLHEIFNLRLSADVVTLSACQTALGREVRGEGLVGLTRGFMYAGAPRVVASLWQVDDLATAELMKRFYQGMLKNGLRPAAALRSAQLELIKQKRWASPFFWSAFVIQGDWK